MELVVYYEGSDSVRDWVKGLVKQDCTFKKLPSSNYSNAFAQLPSYVADILYLDKPDIIISGKPDNIHERPIFSIELASCTPQFQHALQRFSRTLASVANGCPSVLIMPARKKANDGKSIYLRSAAADYGAVRLTDVYGVPAIVVDWPEKDGCLLLNDGDNLPPLTNSSIRRLGEYLREAIKAFEQIDYLGALRRLAATQSFMDQTRARAYASGPPSIDKPGGGGAAAGAQVKLDLLSTRDVISNLSADKRADTVALSQLPDHFKNREKSLVFYPTRVAAHSGDPYVGMLAYYDIAFCRTGPSTRDRRYNLVAYCNGVAIDETTSKMFAFNNEKCPFDLGYESGRMLTYSYHLRDGCRKTKIKPIRIYAELADLIAFTDGILVSP